MTAHYDMTEDDWLAYNLHYLKRNQFPQKQQIKQGILGLLALAVGMLLWWTNFLPVVGAIYSSLGAFLLLISLFYWPLTKRNLRKLLNRGDMKALFGPTSVSLTPKGIESSGPISQGTLYWSAVEKLIETETHLFVQFSAAVNLVIPKRAFATAQEGAQFLRLAEEYRQAATGTPIPTTQRGAWWTQGTQVVETQTQRH